MVKKKTKKKTKAKKGIIERIKSEFTTVAIVMIPIAIGINQAGRLIHQALGLPIWLDTIGTIFTAMLCGPWVAGVGGFLTNVVTALIYGRATSVFFGTVQLGIGMLAGYFTYKGWFKKWWQVFLGGVGIAVTAAAISSVIVVFVRGGVSGAGIDLVFGFFLAMGQNFWTSIFASRFLVEILDKAVIAVFVPWLSIKRLPDRYARMFKYASKIR
ncbi:ECF transporter S component|nr:ECF transporter S component [archaeon]